MDIIMLGDVFLGVIVPADKDALKTRFAKAIANELDERGVTYRGSYYFALDERMDRMRVVGAYARHLFELFKTKTLFLAHKDNPLDALNETKLRLLMPDVIVNVKNYYEKLGSNCITPRGLWSDYVDAFEKCGYVICEA